MCHGPGFDPMGRGAGGKSNAAVVAQSAIGVIDLGTLININDQINGYVVGH